MLPTAIIVVTNEMLPNIRIQLHINRLTTESVKTKKGVYRKSYKE
jgi:hypothetical protein